MCKGIVDSFELDQTKINKDLSFRGHCDQWWFRISTIENLVHDEAGRSRPVKGRFQTGTDIQPVRDIFLTGNMTG